MDAGEEDVTDFDVVVRANPDSPDSLAGNPSAPVSRPGSPFETIQITTPGTSAYLRQPLRSSVENLIPTLKRVVRVIHSHIRLGRSVLLCSESNSTFEPTVVALAFLMYSERICLAEAALKLARTGRGVWIAGILRDVMQIVEQHVWSWIRQSQQAEKFLGMTEDAVVPSIPTDLSWFVHPSFDGTFPSAILPHLFLGDIKHASNIRLLRALGITHRLSVGVQLPSISAPEMQRSSSNTDLHLLTLTLGEFEDNGMDTLTPRISECHNFIGILGQF